MSKVNVEDKINKLGIDSSIVKVFNSNNVITINDLWKLKRKDLKDMNFTSEQINHIIIKMQLNGIDLNKKKY
ncbi:MAG: hypothetical protein IJN90_06890 [Bacilli bacterium]|nr:hypothetical protein [Bacilli bacterium]